MDADVALPHRIAVADPVLGGLVRLEECDGLVVQPDHERVVRVAAVHVLVDLLDQFPADAVHAPEPRTLLDDPGVQHGGVRDGVDRGETDRAEVFDGLGQDVRARGDEGSGLGSHTGSVSARSARTGEGGEHSHDPMVRVP